MGLGRKGKREPDGFGELTQHCHHLCHQHCRHNNFTIAIVIFIVIFPLYFEALNEDEKPGYSSRGTGQAVSVRVMFEGCFYSPKNTILLNAK